MGGGRVDISDNVAGDIHRHLEAGKGIYTSETLLSIKRNFYDKTNAKNVTTPIATSKPSRTFPPRFVPTPMGWLVAPASASMSTLQTRPSYGRHMVY